MTEPAPDRWDHQSKVWCVECPLKQALCYRVECYTTNECEESREGQPAPKALEEG